jgi:hypothetical protein
MIKIEREKTSQVYGFDNCYHFGENWFYQLYKSHRWPEVKYDHNKEYDGFKWLSKKK